MRKIGIFAGTFDPVHDGHIAAAKSTLSECGLDSVLFMVEERPWGSKTPIAVDKRRMMVDLAIANQPNINQIVLRDKRFTTKKTISELQSIYSGQNIHFIFGADVFMKMSKKTWPDLELLLDYPLVIFTRGIITREQVSEHSRGLRANVNIVKSELPDHSSTDVRLKPHSREIWVSKDVSDYIKRSSLYTF